MRISGKDFKEFHDTAWPEDFVWEDESVYTPDGASEPVSIYGTDDKLVMADDEVFTIPDFWRIYDENDPSKAYNLTNLIGKWLREKNSETVIVVIPKENKEKLLEFLKTIEGTASI